MSDEKSYRSATLDDEGQDLLPASSPAPEPPAPAPSDPPPSAEQPRAEASRLDDGTDDDTDDGAHEPDPTGPAEPFAFMTADDLAADLDTTARRAAGDEKPIPVRFDAVADQLGGGLWPGLHILVGGSGVGKTALALTMALDAALAGHPVGYVGLELEPRQVRLRLLATLAGVPWPDLVLGRGPTAADSIRQAREHMHTLAAAPILVECARPDGWPASRLKTMAEALQRKSNLPPLIVVDFLQLLGSEQGKREDSRERIGNAAYAARHIAKDYGAAVLAVSSTARERYSDLTLNHEGKNGRDVEHVAGFRVSGKGTRYMLNRDALIGMGKESGEVEYAADSVSVLVRYRESNGVDGSVIFASPKVRTGVESWCELSFDGTRFSPGGGLAQSAAERWGKSKATAENGETTSTSAARPGAAKGRGKRASDPPEDDDASDPGLARFMGGAGKP